MKTCWLTRSRVTGAALCLVAVCLSPACSSSAKPDIQSGGGGETSQLPSDDEAGARSTNAGAAGKTGHGGNSSGDAGSSASAGDVGAEGGAAGAAPSDPCAACPNGRCLATGQCVACLPDHDECPDGQYCTSANTCVPGCKTGASCASGVCGAGHDCKSCISDQECNASHVCGASQCATACTAAAEGGSVGCSAGLTCCSLHCVDAGSDSQHCGACGTACANGQFCGVAGCQDSTLAGACSVAKITVVLDGQSGNEVPGRSIAQALVAGCASGPAVREVSQNVADALNVTSGRPVAGGGELLISAGGSYFSHLVSYVSAAPVAPVYEMLNGNKLEYRTRVGGKVIASDPFDGPHDAKDVFVIQFMRDASSGSLILNAQGFWQAGTAAAAYYFVHGMLPTLSTQTKSWYVYRWVDGNGDLTPDLNEITAVDAGN